MDKKYNDDAYMRVITIVLPAKEDFSPIIEFAHSKEGTGNDCLIHVYELENEKSWQKIGKGIAGTFCCYYKAIARSVLDAGSA